MERDHDKRSRRGDQRRAQCASIRRFRPCHSGVPSSLPALDFFKLQQAGGVQIAQSVHYHCGPASHAQGIPVFVLQVNPYRKSLGELDKIVGRIYFGEDTFASDRCAGWIPGGKNRSVNSLDDSLDGVLTVCHQIHFYALAGADAGGVCFPEISGHKPGAGIHHREDFLALLRISARSDLEVGNRPSQGENTLQ